MAIYQPQRAPAALRNALTEAGPRSLQHSETSVGSPLSRIRNGVTSESFLDIAILPAGAFYESTRGRPVRRTSVVYDPNWGWRMDSALTLDVGNGSQNLAVIGSQAVNNEEAARRSVTAGLRPEGEIRVTTTQGVEAPTDLVTAQPVSIGAQLGSGDEVVVDTASADPLYWAGLGGGGYGMPYGALGGQSAATYQTIDESVPVYDPYVAPTGGGGGGGGGGYYEPVYAPPAAPQPTQQTYEEWAAIQSELEQFELLGQGQFYWEGPLF
jgi:hypothetical protein